MGKGSRRAGRPRKVTALRTKSGRISRAGRTPERVEPTPEMRARKSEIAGLEISDPLSYIDLNPPRREALECYRREYIRVWGKGGPKVSKMAEYIAGGDRGAEPSEDSQRKAKRALDAAEEALSEAGVKAVQIVRGACIYRQFVLPGEVMRLNAGADALARHYKIPLDATNARN